MKAKLSQHYSMLIQWSEEDQEYVVIFPEWEGYISQPFTGGQTYEIAAKKGREAIESIVETLRENGLAIPPAPQAASVA